MVAVWIASGLWRDPTNLKKVWYDTVYGCKFELVFKLPFEHTKSSWLRLFHVSKNLLQWCQWPRRFEILQPLLAWKHLLVMGIPMMMSQKTLLLRCLSHQRRRNQVHLPMGRTNPMPVRQMGQFKSCPSQPGRPSYAVCLMHN